MKSYQAFRHESDLRNFGGKGAPAALNRPQGGGAMAALAEDVPANFVRERGNAPAGRPEKLGRAPPLRDAEEFVRGPGKVDARNPIRDRNPADIDGPGGRTWRPPKGMPTLDEHRRGRRMEGPMKPKPEPQAKPEPGQAKPKPATVVSGPPQGMPKPQPQDADRMGPSNAGPKPKPEPAMKSAPRPPSPHGGRSPSPHSRGRSPSPHGGRSPSPHGRGRSGSPPPKPAPLPPTTVLEGERSAGLSDRMYEATTNLLTTHVPPEVEEEAINAVEYVQDACAADYEMYCGSSTTMDWAVSFDLPVAQFFGRQLAATTLPASSPFDLFIRNMLSINRIQAPVTMVNSRPAVNAESYESYYYDDAGYDDDYYYGGGDDDAGYDDDYYGGGDDDGYYYYDDNGVPTFIVVQPGIGYETVPAMGMPEPGMMPPCDHIDGGGMMMPPPPPDMMLTDPFGGNMGMGGNMMPFAPPVQSNARYSTYFGYGESGDMCLYNNFENLSPQCKDAIQNIDMLHQRYEDESEGCIGRRFLPGLILALVLIIVVRICKRTCCGGRRQKIHKVLEAIRGNPELKEKVEAASGVKIPERPCCAAEGGKKKCCVARGCCFLGMVLLYLVAGFFLIHGAHVMTIGIIEATGVVPMDQTTELSTTQKLSILVIFLSTLLLELVAVFGVCRAIKANWAPRKPYYSQSGTAATTQSPAPAAGPSSPNGGSRLSTRVHQMFIYPTQKLFSTMKTRVNTAFNTPSGYAQLPNGDDEIATEMVQASAPILVEVSPNMQAYGQPIIVPMAVAPMQAHSYSNVSMI